MEGFCDGCEQAKPTEHWRCCNADLCVVCGWDPVIRTKAAGKRAKQKLQSVFAKLIGKAS